MSLSHDSMYISHSDTAAPQGLNIYILPDSCQYNKSEYEKSDEVVKCMKMTKKSSTNKLSSAQKSAIRREKAFCCAYN